MMGPAVGTPSVSQAYPDTLFLDPPAQQSLRRERAGRRQGGGKQGVWIPAWIPAAGNRVSGFLPGFLPSQEAGTSNTGNENHSDRHVNGPHGRTDLTASAEDDILRTLGTKLEPKVGLFVLVNDGHRNGFGVMRRHVAMKSLLLHLSSCLVMAMVTCTSLAVRADMPSELLNYIPAVPNAVAVVDAAQLFQSPLAQARIVGRYVCRRVWVVGVVDAP